MGKHSRNDETKTTVEEYTGRHRAPYIGAHRDTVRQPSVNTEYSAKLDALPDSMHDGR